MRIEPQSIADALLLAPGWARVGLTAPTPHMREAAARELAVSILAVMQEPDEHNLPDQLGLAL